MWAWTYESKLARDAWDFINMTLWLVSALMICVCWMLNFMAAMLTGHWFRWAGVIFPPVGAVNGFMDLMAAITGYGV